MNKNEIYTLEIISEFVGLRDISVLIVLKINIMKKNYLLVLLFLLAGVINLKAQRAAVASGSDVYGSGGNVSYSVGEIVVSPLSGSNGTALQGVQVPYEVLITSIDEPAGIGLSITVFPNPVADELVLQIADLPTDNLRLQLTDIVGKQLLSKKIIAVTTNIDMNNYAIGTYMLQVLNSSCSLKTFTIIKNK